MSRENCFQGFEIYGEETLSLTTVEYVVRGFNTNDFRCNFATFLKNLKDRFCTTHIIKFFNLSKTEIFFLFFALWKLFKCDAKLCEIIHNVSIFSEKNLDIKRRKFDRKILTSIERKNVF